MDDDLASPGLEPAQPHGCLLALSQPPLLCFLAVIAALLLATALYDLCRW